MYAQKRYQTIKSFFALHKIAVVIFVITILFLTQCSRDQEILDDTFYHLEIPEHFPYPEIPDDNILTKGKIELGKKLFFDKTLSIDSTIACASCHKPEHGFSDNIAISRGVENRTGFRNASSLTNVAYAPILLRDGGFPTLETQVAVPVQDHNEMDFNMLELSVRLKNDAYYKNEFIRIFGAEPEPGLITKALAAFERTLISGNSKYDKAMNAVAGVFLTESEVEGYNLFFGDKLQCKNCHSGFNFTDQDFQNNGLLENYDTDEGRARITGLSEDIGKFKIPTLRNVELTAPYMHDGSIGTLNEVIDFYMSGGSNHPNKNNLIQAFTLTETEKQSLIDFLKTLTDETFINNPEWRNN